MHTQTLKALVATTFILLIGVGSAFAQEAAEAEAVTDISPLVFLVGAALVVGIGLYLALNTRVDKDDPSSS